MIRHLGFFCLFAALLSGCKKDETVTAYGGAGKIWVLVELDGKPVSTQATLIFPEPGKIAGRGPCNSFSATMTVPHPWFDAGPIAATRRACPDLPAEADYFAALSEMTIAEVLGDVLILSTDGERKMIFNSGV